MINNVFNKKQTMKHYTIGELMKMVEKKDIKIRASNKLQVRMIKNYIFENALIGQIYLPPIVAGIEVGNIEDEKPMKLSIIDGTQRILALSQLEGLAMRKINSENKDEMKRGYKLLHMLDHTEIAVQIFEGLSVREADQLYIDLNTKGKKVPLSKRIAYDSRNDINQTTNEVLHGNALLKEAGVEQEKRAVIRPKNKNLLSLSQLRQLVGLFLTGEIVSTVRIVSMETIFNKEESIQLMNSWFEALFRLYPVHSIGNYEKCMLANYPLLQAVAIYAVNGLENKPFEEKKQAITDRMEKLKHVNWDRENKIWRQFDGSKRGRQQYFYLMNNRANIKRIVHWLQIQGGG